MSSSLRINSSSLSEINFHVDDNIESEIVSAAGDIGDRALKSNRHSGRVMDVLGETENENGIMEPEISTDLTMEKQTTMLLPPVLEYISCLVYLSLFAILGVLTRYILQRLFGPKVAGVTRDHSLLYIDLPCNMVGSFLMGWWGVVFREEIASLSDHLAIGLTTGYLGSLSSFSNWIQKMLDLIVAGQWVSAIVGFLLGFFLIAYSIKLGIGTAKCLKKGLKKKGEKNKAKGNKSSCRIRHLVVMGVLVVMLLVAWIVSGKLLENEINSESEGGFLWLACLVAAPGVWIRWFFARLNGRGIGKNGHLKWLPFGTLVVNLSAASIIAALSLLQILVESKKLYTVTRGIKFGFTGCLSTIAAFIAEYNAMEESNQNWRAYAYALTTLIASLGLGILIYCVPLWTKT